MTAHRSVKISKVRAQIVAVIASRPDLHRALRMTSPPDLFELRLDHLIRCLGEVERKTSILPAPIIITARHPDEGGANRLSLQRRHALLGRFLPRARYIHVELRSTKTLRSVLDAAHRKNIRRIISFHNFEDTPSVRVLKAKARAAKSRGACIFKVATRTDTPAQLTRLLDFAADNDVDLAISAMGMGKLGALSRIVLAQLGSVLIYTSLCQAKIEGQLSIRQLRSAFSALKII
jgi:3-dehydroquinate dehydratase-1